jgi:hypothetical protein
VIAMSTLIGQPLPTSRDAGTADAIEDAWEQFVQRYQHRAVLALDAHLPRGTADGPVCIVCAVTRPCPTVHAAMFALEL